MPNQLTAWDQVFSTEDTNEILRELASVHLSEVSDETVREWIHAAVNRGDYHYLCNFDLDYQWVPAPLDAYNVRQALAFFQKRADLDIGVDRKAVAIAKFKESEELCRKTNARFRAWGRGDAFAPYVEGVLHDAQRKISSVLGKVPRLADLKIRFGPGATTAVKRKDANARAKLGSPLQCSADLVPSLAEVLGEIPGWLDWEWSYNHLEMAEEAVARVDVQVVDAKVTCVPKTAKTDRTIGVEPVLNSFFQLGIGDYMSKRLAAVGIDLKDQTRNQRLARYGSLTGELATLDLSSASDTIAIELVAHLLPPDWFDFLRRFRSGWVELEGERVLLQKFSSMGNGFTFPLETLIFWALAASCCGDSDYWCTVYGDDIIVPTRAYDGLVEVLESCGFVPNKSKSFSAGPFRESCGKDYLNGFDIRPCYIKGPLSGESLFVLHNFYVRSGQPELASRVLAYIHPVLRKWGPDGYGDGHLLGDWDRVPHKLHRGWGGVVFETYIRKAKRDFKTALPGDRVLPSYSIYAHPGRDCRHPTALEREAVSGVVMENESGLDIRHAIRWASQPLDDGSRYVYDRKGRLGCSLPGSLGYKLVSIYTLAL